MRSRAVWLAAVCVLTACGGSYSFTTAPELEGDEPGECSDDADNDGDGLFDCLDEDCFNAKACCPDEDGDSVCDDDDVCPGQNDTLDADGDGIPDACDICPGTGAADRDGDGVCDPDDQCPGFDDAYDLDGDGVPDACDPCPADATDDSDLDGVCDRDDVCPGFDDTADEDEDGVPDDCDVCPRDALDDADGDGLCDSEDVCPGFDDSLDRDGDSVPDGCDTCPDDSPDDSDGDGVCDTDDICAGSDDGVDGDGDGVPDGCDPCPLDLADDSDGDGVCDTDDICADFDDTEDGDGDGVPDGCDPCPLDFADDSDGDGVCDGEDQCPGEDDTLDRDEDGLPDACDDCPDDPLNDQDEDGLCDSEDPCPLGDDADQDGDGYPCDEDCEDLDSTIAPQAGDQAGDGVDGDCDGLDCEAGRDGAVYYAVCATTDDWADAEALCLGAGYDGLGSILSPREQNQVEALMVLADITYAWFGLSDAGSEGQFYWTSGLGLGFTNWAEDEPNNLDGFENCGLVEASRGFAWNDGDCELHARDGVICELRCADADGDGVCDVDDICPLGDDGVDVDLDGVPDACDLCLAGDDEVDSDGDDVPDACDPCPLGDFVDGDGDSFVCADDCDDDSGSVYPRAGDVAGDGIDGDCDGRDCEAVDEGSVYWVVCPESVTWEAAQSACLAGGYDGLASVLDASEQGTVASVMASAGVGQAWFGLNDRDSEGSFVFVDGTVPAYTNWFAGEPNNFGGNEDCGLIHTGFGYQWNDDQCDRSFDGYVCDAR